MIRNVIKTLMTNCELIKKWLNSNLFKMKSKHSNRQKWGVFIQMLFDPFVFILSLIIIAFIYCYTVNSANADIRTFLTIGISILSSVWAGIVSNKWLKIFEEQAIEARGKTAIKNLSLLISSIENVEKRIDKFQKCCEPAELNKELLKSNFQEIEENLKILKDIGYNSIETWKDIIPEADLSKIATRIKELQGQLGKQTNEKNELKEKLSSIKDETEETKSLRNKLENYETQIGQLSSELHNCKMSSPGGALYEYIENSVRFTCPHCGHQYNAEELENNNCQCPKCSCQI